MHPRQKVNLTQEDIQYLNKYIRTGSHPARSIIRARILLLLHKKTPVKKILEQTGVNKNTVPYIKKRFFELKGEVKQTILEKQRPGRPAKITTELEARITAIACSRAPEGYGRWALRMLADRAVELGYTDSISHESVRASLKKAS